MHVRLIAVLALVALASGCISGNVLERQLAEPNQNISSQVSSQTVIDLAECNCPGSITTCPDGFNATCENQCYNNSCTRCTPDCSNHQTCITKWFCASWSPCINGTQARVCIDSGCCNKTVMTESRPCQPDRCQTHADCPAEANCTRYFCEGSPKECKPYTTIPCCGDGICESGEVCLSDCQQQAQQNPSRTENQTNQSQSVQTYASNLSIINITYKLPESVEIFNSGNASQEMENWTLQDNASHIFTFPAFTLAAGSSVKVHTENGTNSITDLFWNRVCRQGSYTGCIWNDDGDTAMLKDSNETIISIYSY